MALVLAYVAGAAAAPSQARDVTRKVAGALLLALLSVSLSRWLANTVVTPVTWDHLFYLKLVIPPIMVVFWCAALMPRETRSLGGSTPALHLLHCPSWLCYSAPRRLWSPLETWLSNGAALRRPG